MSKVAIYRIAVLACAGMTLSARTHEQIGLVVICWIVLALAHDSVMDSAAETLLGVVAPKHAERKRLGVWLTSDLPKRKR